MIRLSKEEVDMRQFVTRKFVSCGCAPSVETIAEELSTDIDSVKCTLSSLANNKALVLHPHNSEVWIAHPFSASPNSFWIKSLSSNKGWWSNCTWCAFGASSLLNEDVELISRYGGESEKFSVQIIDGKLANSDFVVHMALPVSKLWDNVIHSCSMMLPFKSENDVDLWCKRHQFEKGAVLSAEKCFELAKKWYGPYLDEDWNRKSQEEVSDFFKSIGLDLTFNLIK